MKKLVLMTYEEEARIQYELQLDDFFEGRVQIASYSVVNGNIPENISADLFILSFADLLEEVDPFIPKKAKLLYLSRTFIKDKIERIKNISNEKVILFDYSDILATETLGIFREIGCANLNIEIVTEPLQLIQHKENTIITAGRDYLIPEEVKKKVINIGYYRISLTTFADIAQRLDLMDEVMNRKLYYYSKKIEFTNSGIIDTLRHAWNFRREFEMILEFIEEGALVYNEKGVIIHINKFFNNLIRENGNELTINDFPPSFKMIFEVEEDFKNRVFNPTNDLTMLISKYHIQTYNDQPAYLVIAKDISSIQKLDYKIRVEQAKSTFKAKYTFDQIITYSPHMTECISVAKKLAKTNLSVLIIGENGTGKEMFAQSIHNYSQRSNMPFVAINCAALPHDLLESELFGYEEGAFTGARKGGKKGIFELGHKGTVFLDEIGDMPMSIQVKLLRVLQEKEVMRIGSETQIHVDTRIIAATNADIEKLVQLKKFRQDLYYRLNVAQINIPPLRERSEDIIPLAYYFLRKYSDEYHSCSEALRQVLVHANWEGNIRELENLMQYLVNVGGEELGIEDLPIRYKQSACKMILTKETSLDYKKIISDMLKNRKIGRRRIKKELEQKGIYLSEYQIRLYMQEILNRNE